MPDLRLNAGAHGLVVANGVIETSQVSKADAEKLLAQISATMIGSGGRARSGYLKVRADAQGNLRFTAGHWGRDEKAAAAQLMLGLAAKAWGKQSVDTRALENYLRAPDRRTHPDQNVAEGNRQLGTRSLLKLMSNRHLAYRDMRRQAVQGDDATVSRLEAYGDRFRGDGQRQGGRLSLDSGGPTASRTREILAYPKAGPKPAAAGAPQEIGSASSGPVLGAGVQGLESASGGLGPKLVPVVRQAVGKAHETALSSFAELNGRGLTDVNRDELDRLRIDVMKSFQARLFDQMDPAGCRVPVGRQRPEFKLKGALTTQNLDDLAGRTGLSNLDDWRSGLLRGDLNASTTRVLLSDDLVEGGERYFEAQAALDELQSGFRKNVFLPQAGIEKLMTTYWAQSGEARPDPARPADYAKPGVASNALRAMTDFFANASASRNHEDFLRLDRPAPLDFALMGIKGVDSLNRGPINDILRKLPKECWKAGADPHPAWLIQQTVDEFNRRVMGA